MKTKEMTIARNQARANKLQSLAAAAYDNATSLFEADYEREDLSRYEPDLQRLTVPVPSLHLPQFLLSK